MSSSVSFVSHPLFHGTSLLNRQHSRPVNPRRPLPGFSVTTAKAGSKNNRKAKPKPSKSDPFSSLAVGPSSKAPTRLSKRSSEKKLEEEAGETVEEDAPEPMDENESLENENLDQSTPEILEAENPLRAVRALGTETVKETSKISTRKTAADFIAEGIVDDIDEASSLLASTSEIETEEIKDSALDEDEGDDERSDGAEEDNLEDIIGQSADVTGDGSIRKILLKVGEGPLASSNAKVKVEYTGKLEDGTVFDSSRDRKESFSFTLGTGTVIKGWESAVATMRVGETAEFTIAPLYAYGKRGMPPVIPGNATLTFEIELLEAESEEEDSVKRVSDFNPRIPRTPGDIAKSYEQKMDSADDKEKTSFFERFYFISPFMSQTGEKPPWWLNPTITFSLIGLFTALGFYLVYVSGAIHIGYLEEPVDVNIFK